jgi:hypothetical protein
LTNILMDDIVLQAMRKWPHVPACYGWLGLDARGQWWMRDDRTQQLASFQAAISQAQSAAKGSLLAHEKLIAFIGRNYTHDEQGRWFFQNGPQRVYVELAHTPWVLRVSNNGDVHTHTGQPTSVTQAISDEQGRLYLETPLGLGLVHTQDVGIAGDFLPTQWQWTLQDIPAAELPQRFGYVPSPQQQQVLPPL